MWLPAAYLSQKSHPCREQGAAKGGHKAYGEGNAQAEPWGFTQGACKAGKMQQWGGAEGHGKAEKCLLLEDAPKKGRPRKLEGEALERAIQLGIGMPVGSSRTVSEELASEGYPAVHASTLCRVFNRAGVKYGRAKRGFVITEENSLARLAFAATHGDSKTDFRRVMFADSKIFVLDKFWW